jgi:acyl dehydratase
MLYALGVGACLDDPMSHELKYVTENNSVTPLQALPTMCTVLGGVLGAPSPLDDIGDYDKRMSVHGSVELILHRPLSTQGSLVSTVAVDGIYDKKRGALVSMTVEACEAENGPALFEVRNGIFVRGEGGWGGDGGPPWPGETPGHRPPDVKVTQTPRNDQPLLYRLNGDRNPLHSDPSVAESAGFARPIMHGMCTLGFVGRALLHEACADDPSLIRAMGCRFAAPAIPGEPFTTQIWRVDDGFAFDTVSSSETRILSAGYLKCRSA